ncbi:MAG: AI-2E family transporter [Candidatus Doudnabacteria bacterium]|nr:AI-2E family transporter [Candidatus Doudnabacteria bacterium]
MKYADLENSTKVILKVVFVVLALAFLWVTRDVILILLLSLILASAMEPMVDYFNEKRVPRAVSVLVTYLLFFGLIGLIIFLAIPPVVSQFGILKVNLPQYLTSLQERLSSFGLGNVDVSDFIKSAVSSPEPGSNVLSQTFGVFNGLLSFVSVLVISFYLVAEEQGMKKFVGTLLPERHHEFTLGIIEKIQKKMGLWILGQLILSVSIFVLTWVGLSILGIKYAFVLAIIAGMLEVIPYIGPFLSAVPAMFVAFIQNPPLAFAVGVLYLLIQKTEGYILVPKVMEKTVGTSPLAVLLAVLIGFKLAGVVGLLIAVPLVSAITVIVNEFWAAKTATNS